MYTDVVVLSLITKKLCVASATCLLISLCLQSTEIFNHSYMCTQEESEGNLTSTMSWLFF